MTIIEEKELAIYRQIEQLIKENKDNILTEIAPADCKCSQAKKKVFRCPGAFQINLCLDQLEQLRVNRVG